MGLLSTFVSIAAGSALYQIGRYAFGLPLTPETFVAAVFWSGWTLLILGISRDAS